MNRSAWIVIAVSVALAGLAQAEGFTVWPFLTNATSGSMDVCFQSDRELSAEVLYGPTADYSMSVPVQPVAFEATWGDYALIEIFTTYEIVTRYSYCARLEGLEPDTLYHYAVRLGDQQTPDATLVTAPEPGAPFAFAVYGDSRSDYVYRMGVPNVFHQDVVERIQEFPLDFFLNTGDIVNDGHDMRLWEISFGIVRPLATLFPYFPTYGNHEDREQDGIDGRDVFSHIFSNPSEGSGSETYYSFDYGNAHFAIVSTDDPFEPGADQDLWLRADLTTARADPDIDWVFMAYHIPGLTSSFRWPNDDKEHLAREYLVPMAVECGVDLVFTGHEHSYERSLKDGVTFIVTGTGGALPTFVGNSQYNPWSLFFEPNADFAHFGFCFVEIAGDYLTLESWLSDGTLIDAIELGNPPADDDDDAIGDDDSSPDDDDDAGEPGGEDDDDDGGCGC